MPDGVGQQGNHYAMILLHIPTRYSGRNALHPYSLGIIAPHYIVSG
jgi:hypothetical protein